MRRTAVGILLAGFVFVFFSIPFQGVDLLLDPVGFLLLFNGARALQKIGRAEADKASLTKGGAAAAPLPTFGFSAAQALAIILLVISGFQVFAGAVTGMASGGGIAGALRSAVEILFFLSLLRGFLPLLESQGRRVLGRFVSIALVLNMAASALTLVGTLITTLVLFSADPSLAGLSTFLFVTVCFTAAVHVFSLAVFIWLLVKIHDGPFQKKRPAK